VALSLKDPRTDRLARQVARLTGESLTDAVRIALSERLARERLKRARPANLADELEAVARRVAALPVLDPRPPDEILGYDDHGLPR